jgi:hypothetical protein
MEQRIEELESRVADLEQQLSGGRSERGLIGNILGIHRRDDDGETDDRIKACVEELFKNDNTAFMTGAKKALYREILKVVIELLKDGLSTASVNFYGHTVKFALVPESGEQK